MEQGSYLQFVLNFAQDVLWSWAISGIGEPHLLIDALNALTHSLYEALSQCTCLLQVVGRKLFDRSYFGSESDLRKRCLCWFSIF